MGSKVVKCPLCHQLTTVSTAGKLELHGGPEPGHCTGSGNSLYRVRRMMMTNRLERLASWPRV